MSSLAMSILEDIKAKAKEVFAESYYADWNDVFGELDGECVSEKFIEEHRWYSLFEQVYQIEGRYFRVHFQSGDENFEPEYDPDDVVQVYPKEVTTIVYSTDPN